MKIKKLMSLGLASVMMSSLVVSAGAVTDVAGTEVSSTGSATTAVSSSINIPTFSIVVPLSDAVVLNPFGLDYKIPGTSTTINNQVCHATRYVQNKSSVPIDVSYVATAVASEGITYVADISNDTYTAVRADTETKQVALGIKTQTVTDSNVPITSAEASAPIAVNASDFIMDSSDPTKTSLKIEEADTSTKQFLAYDITGFTSKTTSWGADDSVDVSIAWTFGPHMN